MSTRDAILAQLHQHIRSLDEELQEGDITQKGYEKKLKRLNDDFQARLAELDAAEERNQLTASPVMFDDDVAPPLPEKETHTRLSWVQPPPPTSASVDDASSHVSSNNPTDASLEDLKRLRHDAPHDRPQAVPSGPRPSAFPKRADRSLLSNVSDNSPHAAETPDTPDGDTPSLKSERQAVAEAEQHFAQQPPPPPLQPQMGYFPPPQMYPQQFMHPYQSMQPQHYPQPVNPYGPAMIPVHPGMARTSIDSFPGYPPQTFFPPVRGAPVFGGGVVRRTATSEASGPSGFPMDNRITPPAQDIMGFPLTMLPSGTFLLYG
jgi:hypothetical protein